MLIRSLATLVVVVSVSMWMVAGDDDDEDISKSWYTQRGAAGLRVRLSEKGANYLRQVGIPIINDEIKNVKGITANSKFGGGSISLTNMHVTKFKPADLSVVNFEPPRSVVVGLENMDIGYIQLLTHSLSLILS